AAFLPHQPGHGRWLARRSVALRHGRHVCRLRSSLPGEEVSGGQESRVGRVKRVPPSSILNLVGLVSLGPPYNFSRKTGGIPPKSGTSTDTFHRADFFGLCTRRSNGALLLRTV